MKHYKTSTGRYVHLIQGQGLGNGVPRGNLKLVSTDVPPPLPSQIEILRRLKRGA